MKSTNEIINNIEDLDEMDSNFDATHLAIHKLVIESDYKVSYIKRLTNLDKSIGHKYFSGSKKFTRDALLTILIVLEHDYELINNFLKKNGYAQLYVRDERDFWIVKGIKQGLELEKINDMLASKKIKRLC